MAAGGGVSLIAGKGKGCHGGPFFLNENTKRMGKKMTAENPEKRQGFTLIELLVVIAIVSLLLAILMPSLRKAKEQSQAVVCLSTLKQWGILYSLYAQDYDSSLPVGWNGGKMWMTDLLAYYQNVDELRVCPRAKRFLDTVPGQVPDEFTAWGRYGYNGIAVPYWGEYGQYGSYSVNGWAHNPLDVGVPGTYNIAPAWRDYYWRKISQVRVPSAVPLMGGGMWEGANALDTDAPPPARGAEAGKNAYNSGGLSSYCLDRHRGGPNWLFVDGQVRKVGMKELWRLKWHPKWDNSRTHSWPEWMQGYPDY